MIVTGGLRALQLLFCVIILGISVSLIKGQEWPSPVPSQTSYAAFCGGWGLLIALVGIAALFVEFLQGLIIAALDALTAVLLLAGGITFWATLGVHSCSDTDYIQSNVLIRAEGDIDGIPFYSLTANLTGRCQQAQATTAFLFFSFFAFVATGFLCFKHGSSGGGKGSIV